VAIPVAIPQAPPYTLTPPRRRNVCIMAQPEAVFFAGLHNTGSSCWANALFQALCALPPLHEHLQLCLRALALHARGHPAASPLIEVARSLRGLSAPRDSPATLRLPRLSLLRAAGQQDAHELLMVLLRVLFEWAPPAAATLRARAAPAAAALSGRPLLPARAASGARLPAHPFSFLLARRTRCVACGWSGAWVVDAESALEVAPPAAAASGGAGAPPAPLARLALGALGVSHAEGWRCEGGCGSSRGAERATLLLRPPRVLAVHVKRAGAGGGPPNRAPVAVPLALALPVGARGGGGGGGGGAPPAADARFLLAAALCHVGASGAGHYYAVRRAHARAGSGAPPRRRWLRVSDAAVEELGGDRALFSLSGWASADVCLAFYLLAGGGGACVAAPGGACGGGGGGEEAAAREAEGGLRAAAAAGEAEGGFEGALRAACAAGAPLGALPLLVPPQALPEGCGHEAVELP